MMTVITDTTPKAAQDKYQDYLGYVSEEGALALMSGWTGLDFGAMEPDAIIAMVKESGLRGRGGLRFKGLDFFTDRVLVCFEARAELFASGGPLLAESVQLSGHLLTRRSGRLGRRCRPGWEWYSSD